MLVTEADTCVVLGRLSLLYYSDPVLLLLGIEKFGEKEMRRHIQSGHFLCNFRYRLLVIYAHMLILPQRLQSRRSLASSPRNPDPAQTRHHIINFSRV